MSDVHVAHVRDGQTFVSGIQIRNVEEVLRG
jgi:hypothetical protein